MSDIHALHLRVMSLFPNGVGAQPRQQLGILWRLDGADTPNPTVLVQASVAPDLAPLPDGYIQPAQRTAYKSITNALDVLTPGRQLLFRLTANATRRIDSKTGPDGKRRKGRRVPLRDERAAKEWLKRKGAGAGFEIPANSLGELDVIVHGLGARKGSRGAATLTVEPAQFDGHLLVTDPTKLVSALQAGIGPAKAYGCGLLSLEPLQP